MLNFAHELFLLSTNLSQYKSKVLIQKIFIESINSIFIDHEFSWSSEIVEVAEGRMQVCTRIKTYGYINYSGQSTFTNETFSLLQNAAQWLAILFEKLEQEALLNDQKKHLSYLVEEKTKDLVESQKKLEIQKYEIETQNEEYLQINEELKQTNDELVRAKEKAEETENLYKSLFQNLESGLSLYEAIYDKQGVPVDYRFLAVNSVFENIFGFKADLLVGKTLLSVFPTTEPFWLETFRNVVLSGKQSKIENYNRDFNSYFEVIAYIPQKGQLALIGEDITLRKKNEIEIIKAKEIAEESEERFNLAMKASNDGLFDWNLETNEFYYSPGWKKMLGYEDNELPNNFSIWENNTHPEDLKKSWELQQKLITKQIDRFVIEFKMKHKDGHWVDILSRAEAFFNDSGKAVRIVGTHTDITERKRIELELAESLERFKALHNASFGGIIIHDKGIILECNQGLSEITGYSLDELIGMNGLLLIAPNSRDYVLGNILAGYEKPYEAVGLRKNGDIFPLRMEARNVPYKGKMARTVEFRDITESKQAEEALRKSEAIKNTMVSNIGDVIVIIDENGVNKYKSPNITKLFGWKPEELVAKSTWDNVHPDDLEAGQKFIGTIAAEPNATGTTELRYKRKDGEYVWIEINITNLLHDNDIQGLLGNYRNISDRKNAEIELIAAKEKAEESDRLKTAFLQNMSHEIRTPMNAIMGFSSLLPENFNNLEKLQNFSNIINQRCRDLLDIINDILDISKIESGQSTVNIEECNLYELFSELKLFIRDYQNRTNKQHIEFMLNPLEKESDFIIKTDKVKLKQILINLISNAFKFTEKGSVKCGVTQANNKLQFYVTDTGMGIPSDKFDFIFERFAQLKNTTIQNSGGNGLGLPIVKGLVGLLGGEVWLQSECDKGSTFYFTIDYAQSNSTNVNKLGIEDKQEIITDKTILIVEDDYYNAEYLKEVLRNISSNIITVANGLSAVKIVQEQNIDIILMDIRLPDITGYEATRLILKNNPDIKIIAQTAYAANVEHQNAIDAGCVDYISKPTKQEQLLKMMNKYLKQ